MNKPIVLFDLDDTLLSLKFEAFLNPYLQIFSKCIPQVETNTFVTKLLASTKRMSNNQSPRYTLEEVFDASFYPIGDFSKSDLETDVNKFYKNEFASLKTLSAPKSAARDIIDLAFQLGHKVAIATNPLFPKTATQQRLEWANIPVDDYPYAVVTTFEDFHFAKPQTAYYTEILAQLGWPQNPAIMIGNDLEEDIRPATKLGFPTFWVTQNSRQIPFSRHPLSSQGDLKEAIVWLKQISSQHFTNQSFSPFSLLGTLQSSPAAISTMLQKSGQTLADNQHLSDLFNQILDTEMDFLRNKLPAINGFPNPRQLTDLMENNGQKPLSLDKRFEDARLILLDLITPLFKKSDVSDLDINKLFSLLSDLSKQDKLFIRQIYQSIYKT